MNVRFGLMILGQALTGKSTIINSLKRAMNNIKNDKNRGVESKVLNPKSISMEELYGCFVNMSAEWNDGLASKIIRSFVEVETTDM
jgi:dynein heavy chain